MANNSGKNANRSSSKKGKKKAAWPSAGKQLKTMKQVVKAYRIKIEILDGPHHTMDEKGRGYFAYRVRLAYRDQYGTRRKVSSKFITGDGWTRTPNAEDVLACLVSDAIAYAYARGFEDFCSEFDYDPDSREALKTWKGCRKMARKLYYSPDAFAANEAMWNHLINAQH